MSNLFMPTRGPGLGLYFATHDRVTAMNRSGGAVAIGSVVAFDLEGDDAASTTWTTGATTSCTGNVVTPTAGQIAGTEMSVFALVTSLLTGAGADDTAVQVQICGLLSALITDTTSPTPAAMSAGSPMIGATDKSLDIAPLANGLVLALLAETTFTGSATAALGKVQFFGWRGLWATT